MGRGRKREPAGASPILEFAEPYRDEEGQVGFVIPYTSRFVETKSLDEWEEDRGEEFRRWLECRKSEVIWELPGKPSVDEGLEELAPGLMKKTMEYLNAHVEFKEDPPYSVCSCWAMMSWLMPFGLQYAGRLMFHGTTGSGKSTALEVLAAISYRGWHVGDATGPGLFRTIEAMHTTVFLDEYQNLMKQPERKADIDSVLINGFDRMGNIVRAKKDGGVPDIFRPFGPMAIGTRRLPGDDKRNRCCVITMLPKSRKDLKRRIDKEMAQEIRTRLLSIRMRMFVEESAGAADFVLRGEELAESWKGSGVDMELDSRGINMAGSLLLPSLMFDGGADVDDILEQLAMSQTSMREESRGELAARVWYAVFKLARQEEKALKIDTESYRFDPSRITTKDVAEVLNIDLGETGDAGKERIKTVVVTSILKELGFRALRGKTANKSGLDPRTFQNAYDSCVKLFGVPDAS